DSALCVADGETSMSSKTRTFRNRVACCATTVPVRTIAAPRRVYLSLRIIKKLLRHRPAAQRAIVYQKNTGSGRENHIPVQSEPIRAERSSVLRAKYDIIRPDVGKDTEHTLLASSNSGNLSIRPRIKAKTGNVREVGTPVICRPSAQGGGRSHPG